MRRVSASWRRHVTLPGMRLERGLLGATRTDRDLPVACPAGSGIGEKLEGAGCQCRVTDTPVLSAIDPSSLESYCLDGDGYRECPAWKADKEATWKRQDALASP